jgi:RimJ/RimL family protein N-acetyltransferase
VESPSSSNSRGFFGAADGRLPLPGPENWRVFEAHRAGIQPNPRGTVRTILVGEHLAGIGLAHRDEGRWERSYWVGQEFWDRGVATWAPRVFSGSWRCWPLLARVVRDKLASRRVFQKCGFNPTGSEGGFAKARREEVEELVFRRDGA